MVNNGSAAPHYQSLPSVICKAMEALRLPKNEKSCLYGGRPPHYYVSKHMQ